jgi:hypothetical protein
MITPCESCGHKLWWEEREVASIRFVLYFDDDERSDNYTQHVLKCSGCGLSLVARAIKPIESIRDLLGSKRDTAYWV